MSYRVLARAYRSGTFDEVVGQEAVATTLKNAIRGGRVHHGYLFTGTRGVGKTSMARILAKSLNCLAFPEPRVSPCCECDSCKAVSTGEDVDVVEIDAASNTGVDNIRELRSNAAFRPARSRFKIYIIDEVHMLSTGAFNALLKTLEEPPPHVKFILATTESHKVPATIQSRCQRFDFRAIDAKAIGEHLERIVKEEGRQVEDGVIRRIARLANGSMRDALSLLDKLMSFAGDVLTVAAADELIPPPHDELAHALMECVGQSDAKGALLALDRALQSGRTVERFCDNLVEHVRALMLLRVCGTDTDLVDVSSAQRAALSQQAQRFDAPTYVFMIALLEELRRNTKFSGAARALADAAVVRLAMCRQFTDIGELLTSLRGVARTTDGSAKDSVRSPVSLSPSSGSTAPAIRSTTTEPTTSSASPAPSAPARSNSRGSSSAPASSAPPTRASAPTRTVSSSDMENVSRDPLVRKVIEAVDGRLFDIQPPPR